jgi:hypothetical protein
MIMRYAHKHLLLVARNCENLVYQINDLRVASNQSFWAICEEPGESKGLFEVLGNSLKRLESFGVILPVLKHVFWYRTPKPPIRPPTLSATHPGRRGSSGW